ALFERLQTALEIVHATLRADAVRLTEHCDIGRELRIVDERRRLQRQTVPIGRRQAEPAASGLTDGTQRVAEALVTNPSPPLQTSLPASGPDAPRPEPARAANRLGLGGEPAEVAAPLGSRVRVGLDRLDRELLGAAKREVQHLDGVPPRQQLVPRADGRV